MKTTFHLILFLLLAGTLHLHATGNNTTFHGLHTNQLPTVWDEGIPLGNGIMGTLIWQKGNNLRLALDRADLWDLRPVKEFSGPDYSYHFIQEAVKKKDMSEVYKRIDARTSQDIAPTKIPAGAIEFGIQKLGEAESVDLDVHTAVCTIKWKNGTEGQFFTGATDKMGHFKFTRLPDTLSIQFQHPQFELPEGTKESHNSLSRLGYKNGKVTRKGNFIYYQQKLYGKTAYEVVLKWTFPDKHTLEGTYCLTTQDTWYSEPETAENLIKNIRKTLTPHWFHTSNGGKTIGANATSAYRTRYSKDNGT